MSPESWLERIAREVRDPPGSPDARVRALADLVYTTYYLGETSAAAEARIRDAATPIVLREDPALGAALRAANRGQGYVQDGWRPVAPRDRGLVVRKDRIELLVREPDVAGRDEAGDLRVRFPNDRPYAYPDYYLAIGDGGPPPRGNAAAPLFRLYFNVAAEGAPRLLEAVTRTMGRALPRFAMKVLNHPRSYGRPDAAVALVLHDDLETALALLPDIVLAVGEYLAPRVPAFTRRIARGVALAEDPGEGTRLSFGQHRALLVAQGLVRAFDEGADRLTAIARELDAAGIDPRYPFCARATLSTIERYLEGGIDEYGEHDAAAEAGGPEEARGAESARPRPARERLRARGA